MKTANRLFPLATVAFLVWTAGCNNKKDSAAPEPAQSAAPTKAPEPVKQPAPQVAKAVPAKPKAVAAPIKTKTQELLASAKKLADEGKLQEASAKLTALSGEKLSSEQQSMSDSLKAQIEKSVAANAKAAADAAAASSAVKVGPFKVGDVLPDLSRFGLEGDLPAELKGKVVLLDFWASWCGPCKESFPVMDDLHQKYGPQGLVILAVNVDEKAAAMQDFLKDHPVKFAILHDATKKLVSTANISSMPTSFLVGADGRVVVIHKGFHGNATTKEYTAEIEKLLSGRVAAK